MSSGARWIWRTLMVGLGLVLGGAAMWSAVRSASELGVTTDEAARQFLWLQVVGHWLMGFGWIGLFVSVAADFRGWPSLRGSTRVPGGLRGARRANRQINGVEPYRADEVALLRRLAQRRLARRRLSPMERVGNISVIMLYLSFAMAPPGSGIFWLIFRIFCGVMAVVVLLSAVRSWRTSDAKAEDFLERTQPAAAEAWEPRPPGD